MILKGYIFSVLYAFLCMAIALVAYKFGMPKKFTRKIVHVLVGFEWVILTHYMGATYHFLIVCLFFVGVLALVHFKKLMPMMSSDEENAPGTVYYAVAMSVMASICLFIPEMLLPFGVGVFCTSAGDGFAGIVGQLIKKHNPKIYAKKTLFGMIANFIFSSLSAFLISYFYGMNLKPWQCAVIGLVSVGYEVVTGFGLDNIAITLSTAFLTYAFVYIPSINNYLVPIVLTPVIIGAVLSKNVLTKPALVLALILDFAVSFTLGNIGFILIALFLFGSVIIDKIKKRRKPVDTITKRSGDCRDSIQVVANGFVPMMMAILYYVTKNDAFVVGYVAALAEAFADTAASGMGVYSKKTFDIFKMRPIENGLSGGMSIIGTLSSLVGAFIISAVAFAFGEINITMMLVCAASAFLGAIFDSFLGSVFQVKYKCRVCGAVVEREEHCESPTEKHSGFFFFDNDVVNIFSITFAGILAAMISILL